MQITKSVNSESEKKVKHPIPWEQNTESGLQCIGLWAALMFSWLKRPDFHRRMRRFWKEALKTLFENDASSARPEGSMEVCRLYWWQHSEKTPAVSSGKIQRGFSIIEKAVHPKEFADYDIEWKLENCVKPEVYEFV